MKQERSIARILRERRSLSGSSAAGSRCEEVARDEAGLRAERGVAASPCATAAAAAAVPGSRPFARNAATTPVRTSPVPAVASDGGPRSQTTSLPSGEATIVSAPLSRTTAPKRSAASRAAASRWASTHASHAEQAAELARVRREHGRRVALDGLEPEERVGVDDRGEVDALEQLAHERAARCALGRAPGRARGAVARSAAAAIVSTASSSRQPTFTGSSASASAAGSASSGTASVT